MNNLEAALVEVVDDAGLELPVSSRLSQGQLQRWLADRRPSTISRLGHTWVSPPYCRTKRAGDIMRVRGGLSRQAWAMRPSFLATTNPETRRSMDANTMTRCAVNAAIPLSICDGRAGECSFPLLKWVGDCTVSMSGSLVPPVRRPHASLRRCFPRWWRSLRSQSA